MTQNPWRDLPEDPPFVLPQDLAAVNDHNGHVQEDEHKFRTGVLPEPFLGRPDGDVVFLNLNPGYTPGDELVHADPAHGQALRSMLRHERELHPMYLLDPAFADKPGGVWWRKRLRVLAESVGGYEVLSHKVLVLEAFAYPSQRFRKPRLPLPSTEYVTELLRSAMQAGRPVVVIRARRQWEELVPELADYTRRYQYANPQSAYCTPRNCPTGFGHIVEALTS